MLADIIKDWLPIAGWEILEVRGNTICPKHDVPVDPILGNKRVAIGGDSVGPIKAADPDFFEKLDQYLIKKYFSGTAWYQEKIKPKKPRQQIWPK